MSSHTALLVVDVQYDFLPGGALAVNDGDQVLPVVNDLLTKYKWDFVAASQDYHPAGHVSFASTHKQELFKVIDVPYPRKSDDEPATVSQVMWPDHCVQRTRGADIEESVLRSLHPWIDTGRGIVVQKGTDIALENYSAFGASASLPPSEALLASELCVHDINALVVVGLATDYCVRASALDAKKAGVPEVYVIRDAVRSVGGAEATENVEKECEQAGVRFVGLDDPVVKQLLR